jgi:demethylmenaquinone methyltransferase/2-methoxy-6-polyprenyl-1,4-benzoquinol methylase
MAHLTGESKRQYVAGMFARIAGRYDLMNDLMTAGLHRRWKRETARLASYGLQGKALDVATGTGDLVLALARCPGIDQAVGVDLLPQMIATARKKARKRRLGGKATWVMGDALMLPFPEGTFACATAGFSLRNMADLRGALAEMVRVVRPGGRITTLELSPMPGGPKSVLIRWCFHRLVPLMGRIVAGDRAAYTYLPQSVDLFLEADHLASLLRDLGLTGVGYSRLGFGTVTLHWGDRPPN